MSILSLVGLFLVALGVTTFLRVKAIRRNGVRSKAIVTGYESKFRRVGGTWTTLEYPIVEYTDSSGTMQSGWVKFASTSGRYFQIHDEIDIIKHGKYIYYANSVSNKFSLLAVAGIALFLVDLFLVN
ncbi:hypothetical protein [Ekhidna sp.]